MFLSEYNPLPYTHLWQLHQHQNMNNNEYWLPDGVNSIGMIFNNSDILVFHWEIVFSRQKIITLVCRLYLIWSPALVSLVFNFKKNRTCFCSRMKSNGSWHYLDNIFLLKKLFNWWQFMGIDIENDHTFRRVCVGIRDNSWCPFCILRRKLELMK